MERNTWETGTEPAATLCGLLKCIHCRIPMVPDGTGAEATAILYVCPRTASEHQTTCPTPPVPLADIERRLLGRLTHHLLRKELIPDLITAVKEDASVRLEQYAAELQQQQRQLKSLTAQNKEILRKVEEGALPFQEVRHLVQAASLAAANLEAKTKATKELRLAYERAATDDAWTIENARDTRPHLNRTTASSRRSLFHLLIKEITVTPTFITVSYNMPAFDKYGRLPDDKEEISL